MAVSLQSLKRGIEVVPPRIILYGVHGIGKSTWAAAAPNPVFIQTENRLAHLNVTKFPVATHWKTVIESLYSLYQEQHDFQTVVLDSLDWFEQLVHKQIKKDIGEKAFADYNKGPTYAPTYFEELLEGLDMLRLERNMLVILVAHSRIKRFDSPETEPYDRYELDLHKDVASRLKEWSDYIFFTNYKTYTASADVGFNKEKVRGVGQGARMLYTEMRPAYEAKTSAKLPAEMPLDYSLFQNELAKSLNGQTQVVKPAVPKKVKKEDVAIVSETNVGEFSENLAE